MIANDTAGGIVAVMSRGSSIIKSGVIQGRISGSVVLGGVVGTASTESSIIFSEIYSKKSVGIICTTKNCGGLVGYLYLSSNSTGFISDSYTRSNVSGTSNSTGGFIGVVFFENNHSFINISNCYSSNYVSGNSDIATSLGGFLGVKPTINSQNFFFNNQTNPLLPSTISSNPEMDIVYGLECNHLLSIVLSFNQSVWGGVNLRSEYNFFPSTSLCVNCVFDVPNCQNCDQSIQSIPSAQLSVSCALNQNKWAWTFKNSSSDNVFLNTNIVLSNQTYFDSNLVIESNTSISYSISSNRSVSSPVVFVNGCVSVEGDLNVLINFNVEQNINIDLIKYNCSQTATLKNDQVKLIFDKNQNECLKSKNKITTNTISTTISRCTINKALILGIIFGVVGLSIIIISLVGLHLWKRRKLMLKRLEIIGKELNQETKENPFTEESKIDSQQNDTEMKEN